MKSFNDFNSRGGAAMAIRRISSGQSTAGMAALLTLTLTLGICGCSHSKQTANSNQNSATQTQSAQVVAPAVPVTAQTASQAETAKKKSIKKPVKRLPATRTYIDEVSGLSFTYPRKSALEIGDKAEQDGIVAQQLPMNFVETGGETVAVVELPGIAKSGRDFTPAFFAISANPELSAEQCGQFGQDNSEKGSGGSAEAEAPPITGSKLTIGGAEYVELDKETEHVIAKYYHRFVPGTTPDDNACYEFAMSVASGEPKQDADEASPAKTAETQHAGSLQVENTDAFTRLEKILASVSFKSEKKSDAVESAKSAPDQGNAKDAKPEPSTSEAAKTAAKLSENPR